MHDRLVQDLKETCSHPLGGVHPHTAKLIQEMAESHPNYDRLRNDPEFQRHVRGTAGRMDMLRDASQHVADHMMLDWAGHSASTALPGARDPMNFKKVLAATAPRDLSDEPEPGSEARTEPEPKLELELEQKTGHEAVTTEP